MSGEPGHLHRGKHQPSALRPRVRTRPGQIRRIQLRGVRIAHLAAWKSPFGLEQFPITAGNQAEPVFAQVTELYNTLVYNTDFGVGSGEIGMWIDTFDWLKPSEPNPVWIEAPEYSPSPRRNSWRTSTSTAHATSSRPMPRRQPSGSSTSSSHPRMRPLTASTISATCYGRATRCMTSSLSPSSYIAPR